MQRPRHVIVDIVGNINQRRNRTQPDCRQTVFHPLRRFGLVVDVFDITADIYRTGGKIFNFYINGTFERSGSLENFQRLKGSQPGSRQIASHAADAQTFGAVRRYVDFNYRINIKRFRRRTANRRIRRQFNNAVVVFADAELLFGTHHAKTLHAADFADFQFLVITRNNDANRRKNAFQPLSAVWRTTNDLQLFFTGINRQQSQMIRIRMAFISFNFCCNKSV